MELADWNLKDGTGADVAAIAAETHPDCPVLVISGIPDDRIIGAAIGASCSGFVSKGSSVAELAGVIRAVAAGAAVFPAEWLGGLGRTESEHEPLTERELEVLGCLADALTVDEIAEELYLSIHTVRNHVRSIRTKLHARSQLEAVVVAARSGLLSVG
ncbi:MAG: response regulator transcription factor [Actinomycetota bacterium]